MMPDKCHRAVLGPKSGQMRSCSGLAKLAYSLVKGSLEDCVAGTSCKASLIAAQSLVLN